MSTKSSVHAAASQNGLSIRPSKTSGPATARLQTYVFGANSITGSGTSLKFTVVFSPFLIEVKFANRSLS